MPGETFVTVRGEARLEVEPEIAVLAVSLTSKDKERRRAVDRLTARTREVGDLIRGRGEAVERLESLPVRVQPLFGDGKPVKGPAGYLAQAGYTATIADFGVLGELVAELAAQDLVSLGGPSWQIRPDSPVHRQVRIAAARSARERASDYAEAFGLKLGGLAEAADTGLLARESAPAPAPRVMAAGGLMRAMRAPEPDEQQEIDLTPATQVVYAEVEARFRVAEPGTAGPADPR